MSFNIKVSHFYLGLDITKTPKSTFVTLNSSITESYKGDKVSAIFKDEDWTRNCKVRMYNPPLVHYRVSTIRNLPPICVAATLLGGQLAMVGPYQAVIEKENHFKLEYVKTIGVEIIVEGVQNLDKEFFFNLQQDLAEMVLPHFDFVTTVIFPFERD